MLKVKLFFSRQSVIFWVYVLSGIAIALQHYFNDSYNNFTIFKASFGHLLSNKNLHLVYPNEYYDVFLYHPTFAVLFAPFSFLPDWLGLCVWNICSALSVFYAIKLLPIGLGQRVFVWWFVFVELTTALHNVQTNAFVASAIVFTFVFLERKAVFASGFVASLNFFIKGYGGIAAVLIPFYRQNALKNGLYYLLSFAFFSFLPVFFVGFDGLIVLYENWQASLSADHKVNLGVSLIGLLYGFFPMLLAYIPIFYVQLFGLIVLISLFGFVFFYQFKTLLTFNIRLLLLAYVLVWVIVFNHAAESSTHIISVLGVALWYLVAPKNRVNLFLLIFVFLLTCLSPTDIFPKTIRTQFVEPYALKALPIVLVWLRIHIDIWLIMNPLKRKIAP